MASCKEEGCQVLITGKCVNNLEIDVCPHYSDTDSNEEEIFEEENDVDDEKSSILNIIDVYSGKALNLNEVNRISKSSLTRLVVLAGLPDSGKTTLILSLVHLFQTKTSFEGYLFAGSETMLDFEEKSHPSRIASEKEAANTVRTPIGPPRFLHLKVAEKSDTSQITDLLFTDISGEFFVSLKDSTFEAKKFILCQRADHFVLFFDSKRISSIKDRSNSRVSGLGILKSLNESDNLKTHTKIQIIFSRWDLFLNNDDIANHNEFIDLLKQDIISQFGQKFHIEFFEVSARPKGIILPFGFGINKVFPVWVKKSILDFNYINPSQIVRINSKRQFLKYQFNN